jgi:hypothetical protein
MRYDDSMSKEGIGRIVKDYEKFTDMFNKTEEGIDDFIDGIGLETAPEIKAMNRKLEELPINISEITNAQNSNLQGNYATIYGYISRVLARARTREQLADRKYHRMKDRIFLDMTGNVEERKAKSNTDPRVIDLEEIWMKWAGIVRELESVCDSIKENRMTLSRDVELRKQEFDGERRAHNVQRTPAPRPFK